MLSLSHNVAVLNLGEIKRLLSNAWFGQRDIGLDFSLKSWEDIALHVFILKIFDYGDTTHPLDIALQLTEIVSLPHVRDVHDNFIALLLKPFDDHGAVFGAREAEKTAFV